MIFLIINYFYGLRAPVLPLSPFVLQETTILCTSSETSLDIIENTGLAYLAGMAIVILITIVFLAPIAYDAYFILPTWWQRFSIVEYEVRQALVNRQSSVLFADTYFTWFVALLTAQALFFLLPDLLECFNLVSPEATASEIIAREVPNVLADGEQPPEVLEAQPDAEKIAKQRAYFSLIACIVLTVGMVAWYVSNL